MGHFIHLICDYAPGDLAWAEVLASLTAKLPDNVRLHITAVGSFDTISTGFVLAQLGLADKELRPENLVLFANCAPRKDRRDARLNNEGEGLLFGTLKNAVPILAVNSGYSLSFVANDLQELWTVNVEDQGSQFRSRDYFPKIIGSLVNGDLSFKANLLRPAYIIPKIPPGIIGYIDSFGNLKTTFRSSDVNIASFKPGDRITVSIAGIVRTATIATGIFNVMEGDLAFAPGSSGHGQRFWEFFQRGGSAWSEFGRPSIGSQISIQAICSNLAADDNPQKE